MYKYSREEENIVPAPRALRSNKKIKIKLGNKRLPIYYKSPLVHGKYLWRKLDHTLHHAESIDSFKSMLKNVDVTQY